MDRRSKIYVICFAKERVRLVGFRVQKKEKRFPHACICAACIFLRPQFSASNIPEKRQTHVRNNIPRNPSFLFLETAFVRNPRLLRTPQVAAVRFLDNCKTTRYLKPKSKRNKTRIDLGSCSLLSATRLSRA